VNPALRTELRRGVGIWAALPMVAILIAGMLAHQRDWVGDWVGSSYYLRNMLILLGPAVVAAAAWQGGRDGRRGVGDLLASTPRPPLQRELAAVASPTVWAVVSFMVVAAAAAVITAVRASYGRPLVGMLLSAVAATVALAVFGYLAGRFVRWRVAAPLLALVTYVSIAALAYRADGLRYLSPDPEVSSFPGQRPVWWWSPASTATFVLVAAGVLLLVAGRRRWLGVPLLALSVLVAVPIVRTGQDAFDVPNPGSQALVCRESATVELCLSQMHRRQLNEVAAGVAPVLNGLAVRVRLVESSSSESNSDIKLTSKYLGPTLTSGPDLTVMRADVSAGLLRWGCSTPSMYGPIYGLPERVGTAVFPLQIWLEARPDDPPSFLSRDNLTDEQLVGITRDYRTAAATCDEPAALRALAPLTPS